MRIIDELEKSWQMNPVESTLLTQPPSPRIAEIENVSSIFETKLPILPIFFLKAAASALFSALLSFL